MREFFEMIADMTVNMREIRILNNEENKDFVKAVLERQKGYSQLDLTQEQRKVVDELIEANAELNKKEMQEIYKQGFKDCTSLLKDLDLIK